jgi:hypothetical protein
MLVVFAFALLILAAAVVVLFAMLAEVATRVPERSGQQRETRIRRMGGVRLGHAPEFWPDGLPDGERATLLVLSTACGSCQDVAEQLTSDPGHRDWTEMGVVVSTAGRVTGQEFVRDYGFEGIPVFIDEGGEWVEGQFGVHSSPGALIFRSGRLVAAHRFNDVAALRDVVKALRYEEVPYGEVTKETV